MTILTGEDLENDSRQKLFVNPDSYKVSFASDLQEQVLYDENPTPIQKQIEMLITNGRGYLNLQHSLNFVNSSEPKLSLQEVLSYAGSVPIYHKQPEPRYETSNPCGEKVLHGSEKIEVLEPHPMPLVEELRMVQYVKSRMHGCFNPHITTIRPDRLPLFYFSDTTSGVEFPLDLMFKRRIRNQDLLSDKPVEIL